jgi:2-keto-3-deoxy-L-rhamnonate aldolase RhmA
VFNPQQPVNSRLARPVSLGVHLSFLSPNVVEVFGRIGFHWLFLDAQRAPVTPDSCRELIHAADRVGMFCLTRVSAIDAAEIAGYLDAGVCGILAPNIDSVQEAEALVAAVKSAPQAMDATFVAALIESEAGIEQIEAIMAVAGIDYIALGPNDLALSLGTARDDPRVETLLDRTGERVRAAGKPQIAVVSNEHGAREAIAQGATLIAISDAALISCAGVSFLGNVMP